MTDISPTSSANSVVIPSSAGKTPAPTAPGGLGKQDFLKLLMAQLRNQDPLKPMEDTQMIAQMAQFSALEATQQLNATIQQSANVQAISTAGALIGKYIQSNLADGTTSTGAVTGVNFTTTNGVVSPTLVVGGVDVDYSTIVKVSSSPIAKS